ncbi:class 1 fructose-bisphosphatase [Halorubrum sp. JWXQ-INN 858]|uniref:class 1 fructose-bisphosphatase n=1 Tax=Halorubrum sp. JWXQ-INN 858 TaxID=2690782 RepID=UPI00135682DF|nr:class 1 fructose-bisphosphatase [Halorubrum sp. JWXQ-INN 858]MWV63642.1 class 1 fructose-bisphosphatase [Halorubrum sp. JWXQ-INN 858]
MADGDPVVEAVFDAVAATAPAIRDALPGRRVADGAENPSGETVLAGDLYADELLADALTAIDGVGAYVSEERPEATDAGEGYSVAIDPLDGSSNLRSNNAMGTVVGVYDAPLPATGRDLVAAGYTLYGPITTMIVADASGVREEVVERDPDADGGVSRSVVAEDLTLPDDPTVYGFGGRVPDWTDPFRAYAREVESELKLRYGGSMVGDVNQVVTYGGVFAYPALTDAPEGKLRLSFEGNPIAYVIERMGGASSDGSGSILDVEPTGLHDRVPVYVGNEALIERLEDAVADD